MKLLICRMIAIPCVIATPLAASAADAPSDRPEIFKKLVDCRSIAENVQRLACYDAQVAALDDATMRQEVVVVDKAQISKARKTLFGLSLPSLSIFGGNDGKNAEENDVREIESTIKSASLIRGMDRWVFILDDGARWVQTEGKALSRYPKPGMPIRIRKAAMGSFMANVDGQTAIRVRREN